MQLRLLLIADRVGEQIYPPTTTPGVVGLVELSRAGLQGAGAVCEGGAGV